MLYGRLRFRQARGDPRYDSSANLNMMCRLVKPRKYFGSTPSPIPNSLVERLVHFFQLHIAHTCVKEFRLGQLCFCCYNSGGICLVGMDDPSRHHTRM